MTFTTIYSTICFILLFVAVCKYNNSNKISVKLNFPEMAVVAFVIRLIFSAYYRGYETDIVCFDAWSDLIYKEGFSSFYASEHFTDYPPGYMYVLYVIGAIKSSLGINSVVLLKLPAVICDILCGYFIYKISLFNKEKNKATLLSAIYLFNPAIILNSSVWGQVDSVYTLFVTLMIYLLYTKKLILSYFIFAIAILIKPQSLFFAPILIFAIIEHIFLKNRNKSAIFKHLLWGFCAIILAVILCIPFGITNVTEQYKNTISSYNYASVNAYNLWTAIGMNWSVTNTLTSVIGYVFIILSVFFSAYLFFKKRDKNSYFYCASIICFFVYMLSVKMHDRYSYPAILLMLCAFAVSKKKQNLILYFAISLSQFLNSYHVLFYYNPETYFEGSFVAVSIAISMLNVILLLYILFSEFFDFRIKKTSFSKSEILSNITKTDIYIMTAITIIYSAFAFYNLGDKKAPQNEYILDAEENVMIELEKEIDVSAIKFFLGNKELSEERKLGITLYDEEKNVTYSSELLDGAVFFWNETKDILSTAKFIELSASDIVKIIEFAIYDKNGHLVIAQNPPTELFDEQNLIPENQTFKNSTYFDEIYHARTAYEFLKEDDVYEWTHPPLGKIFISLGIKIFGMTPFGWRFAGTLFGIFMLPILYIFTKKMSSKTWLSACATIIFAFDFMHFTQSRIATIDVFVTFFIMLMYLFMYRYYTMNFYDTPLYKTFYPLLISGISFGLSVACKWTGLYAGAGLCILFFATIFKRYTECVVDFWKKTVKTLLFCMLSFVFIPLLIYVISYIPYLKCIDGDFSNIISNQIDMFTYHGETVVSSEHPYSSPWYSWPIILRPIWYYSKTLGDKTQNISAMGNPLVWWTGIISFIYCVKDTILKKNKQAAFLVVSYLAQIIPWVFITRTTFIYHYFPSVPFVVLMNVYMADRLFAKNKKIKKYSILFTLAAVLLFVLFYPAISGFSVNGDYVRNFLRWFPTWQLID